MGSIEPLDPRTARQQDRQAERWVKQTSPDDDYLAPGAVTNPAWYLPAGTGDEAEATSDAYRLIKDVRAARTREARGEAASRKTPTEVTKAVKTKLGRSSRVSVAPTLEQYLDTDRSTEQTARTPNAPSPEPAPRRPPNPRVLRFTSSSTWVVPSSPPSGRPKSEWRLDDRLAATRTGWLQAEASRLRMDFTGAPLQREARARAIDRIERELRRRRSPKRAPETGEQRRAAGEAARRQQRARDEWELTEAPRIREAWEQARNVPLLSIPDNAANWGDAEQPALRSCGNPNGCPNTAKKGGKYCSACYQYRLDPQHRGQDRPAAVINRGRRRKAV